MGRKRVEFQTAIMMLNERIALQDACEHDWQMPTLQLNTDLCEKKPVVCTKCGKRRAWRKGEHYA